LSRLKNSKDYELCFYDDREDVLIETGIDAKSYTYIDKNGVYKFKESKEKKNIKSNFDDAKKYYYDYVWDGEKQKVKGLDIVPSNWFGNRKLETTVYNRTVDTSKWEWKLIPFDDNGNEVKRPQEGKVYNIAIQTPIKEKGKPIREPVMAKMRRRNKKLDVDSYIKTGKKSYVYYDNEEENPVKVVWKKSLNDWYDKKFREQRVNVILFTELVKKKKGKHIVETVFLTDKPDSGRDVLPVRVDENGDMRNMADWYFPVKSMQIPILENQLIQYDVQATERYHEEGNLDANKKYGQFSSYTKSFAYTFYEDRDTMQDVLQKIDFDNIDRFSRDEEGEFHVSGWAVFNDINGHQTRVPFLARDRYPYRLTGNVLQSIQAGIKESGYHFTTTSYLYELFEEVEGSDDNARSKRKFFKNKIKEYEEIDKKYGEDRSLSPSVKLKFDLTKIITGKMQWERGEGREAGKIKKVWYDYNERKKRFIKR
jgi:hypothetical protein